MSEIADGKLSGIQKSLFCSVETNTPVLDELLWSDCPLSPRGGACMDIAIWKMISGRNVLT
jgi:hypothetical protein